MKRKPSPKRRSALKALTEVEQFLAKISERYSDEDIERLLELVRAEIAGIPQFSTRIAVFMNEYGNVSEIRSDDNKLKVLVMSHSAIHRGDSEDFEFSDGTSAKELKKYKFEVVR